MSISRRKFLAGSASVAAGAMLRSSGFAQTTMGAAAATQRFAAPSSEAGKALYAEIGEEAWNTLHQRLAIVNADIHAHGLRKIKG